MKKKVALMAVFTAILATINYSCRKSAADISSNLVTQSSDANHIQSENDQTNSDVNSALSSYQSIGGKTDQDMGGTVVICNGTITAVDSTANKSVTITYNGACNGRTRTGTVKIQLIKGTHWRDVGAMVSITLTHLKITYVNGSTIEFNGTKTLTNVSGGNYWTMVLTTNHTLTTRERMLNMSVTFDGSATATWNSARLSTITYDNTANSLTFTTNGDTTISSYPYTAMWGTTRTSASFVNYYTSAISTNNVCGLHRPTAGDVHHEINGSDRFEVVAGVDASGNAVTSGSSCGSYYGYKILWVNAKGVTKSYVRSY